MNGQCGTYGMGKPEDVEVGRATTSYKVGKRESFFTMEVVP